MSTSSVRTLVLLAFVLPLVFVISPAAAQETINRHGTNSYPGLSLNPYPGSFAMGGGTVALSGRPSALTMNPAAIGRDDVVQAGLDVGAEHLLASEVPSTSFVDEYAATPSVTLAQGRWAVGIQYIQYSYDDVEIRDGNGDVIERGSLYHRSFRVAGAYDVSDVWTIGLGLGYNRDERYQGFVTVDGTEQETAATALTLDLGAHGAWTIERESGARWRPSVGVSLTNFGPNSDTGQISFDIPTPTTFRLGGAVTRVGASEWNRAPVFQGTVHVGLSKVLAGTEREGNDTRTYGAFEALTAAWGPAETLQGPDGSYETVSAWGQINKHIGGEVTLYDIGSVRVGRRQVNSDFSGRSFTSVGAGVDLVYGTIEYARTIGGSTVYEDQSYVRLTATIPLDGSYDNNWWK